MREECERQARVTDGIHFSRERLAIAHTVALSFSSADREAGDKGFALERVNISFFLPLAEMTVVPDS